MALNPPVPGLRRLHHDSNSATKVQINVPAGDELEVSEEIAAQLTAADSHFIDADARDAKGKAAKARADEAARVEKAEGEELEAAAASAAETLPETAPRTKAPGKGK